MNSYLFLSAFDILEQLDIFSLYVDDVEEFIESQTKKYERIVKSYDHVEWGKDAWGFEEPPADGIEAYQKFEIFENYPGLLRSSLFVWLCTFLEDTLMKECDLHTGAHYSNSEIKEESLPLTSVKFSDKSSMLDKAKKCLSENLRSKYQFGASKEWASIKQYQVIRNCLVHAGGNLGHLRKKDRGVIESFAEHNPEIFSLFDNKGSIEIFLEKGFCESYIVLISKFLEDLNNAGMSA